MKSAIVLGIVLLAASFGSSASLINVGGVLFDPDVAVDFAADSGIKLSNLDGDKLTGVGRIGSINDTYNFCPGCELTFSFDYDLLEITESGQASFGNGVVDFYVDGSQNYNGTLGNATDGDLWLSLVGHSVDNFPELFASLTNGVEFNASATGNSFGLLDVTGGLAFEHFNTNLESDGADVSFTASFQPSNSEEGYPFFGSADFSGATVPEPAPVALLGLGLLGMLMSTKKRNTVKA